MTRPFTGRHMALILIGFFAVVIVVNLFMARLAGSTFGGVVVENSYVASQNFNRWLDQAASQRALGWTAKTRRLPDGRVSVSLDGLAEGAVPTVSGVARHPLGSLPDAPLAFVARGNGGFVSTAVLPAGRWRLRLSVVQAGRVWRSEGDLM